MYLFSKEYVNVTAASLPTASCPYLFTDVYSNYTVSVCNFQENTTSLLVYDVSGSSFKGQSNLAGMNPTWASYLNGFLFLSDGLTVDLYTVAYDKKIDISKNETDPYQVASVVVSNGTLCTNFEAVNVSMGKDSSSVINPTIGFTYFDAGEPYFFYTSLTVPNANHSVEATHPTSRRMLENNSSDTSVANHGLYKFFSSSAGSIDE